jgi:hypothetical protein
MAILTQMFCEQAHFFTQLIPVSSVDSAKTLFAAFLEIQIVLSGIARIIIFKKLFGKIKILLFCLGQSF